jgi:hypothetical protein
VLEGQDLQQEQFQAWAQVCEASLCIRPQCFYEFSSPSLESVSFTSEFHLHGHIYVRAHGSRGSLANFLVSLHGSEFLVRDVGQNANEANTSKENQARLEL